MKAVLISIRPEWCVKIASGEKIIEVRKTRPRLETPFKCYIYCTKGGALIYCRPSQRFGNGKVIGELVCDGIYAVLRHPEIFAGIPLFYKKAMEDACMTENEIEAYSGGKDLCGWHISNLKIYDEPKELIEFWTLCPEYNELGPSCWDCENVCGDDEADCNTDGRLYLTRPPQSWCYVEEMP